MRTGVQMIEENLREAMRFFGESSTGGEVAQSGPVQLVYSGMDYGVFNIALLTQPLASEHDLHSVLDDCARFYRHRRARWSFWVCEDMLELGARRRNRDLFIAAGMRAISHAPGMVCEALAPPVRALPPIECRPVTDAESRSLFTGLTVTCFDIPMNIGRAIYEQESGWRGAYSGFLAIAGGVPVSIVALARAGGALGIYSLGTLPEYRCRGYGEALIRAAVSAYRGDPAEPLVLESTEAGYRLYKKLGFRDTTSFTVYLTK